MFSRGRCDGGLLFFSASANRKVIKPILPKYIRMIITVLDAAERAVVIPKDSPTVAIADVVSKIAERAGTSSNEHIKIEDIVMSARYEVIIAAACCKRVLFNLRFTIMISRSFFAVEIILQISTTNVVVFIPPAVEPELPPINMSSMLIIIDESFISAKFIVLNPAVLVVTD